MKTEQIKQHSFEVINNLIKENNSLQKKVTLLEEQLLDNIKELGEARKIKAKCIKAEEELKKSK